MTIADHTTTLRYRSITIYLYYSHFNRLNYLFYLYLSFCSDIQIKYMEYLLKTDEEIQSLYKPVFDMMKHFL